MEAISLFPLACSNSNKRIVLSSDEFLKKSKYIGTIEGSDCYDYENMLILNQDIKTNIKYDFSKIDSLEITKTPDTSGGKSVYAISRTIKK